MPSQDVRKFTPVSYRTSALLGRCPERGTSKTRMMKGRMRTSRKEADMTRLYMPTVAHDEKQQRTRYPHALNGDKAGHVNCCT